MGECMNSMNTPTHVDIESLKKELMSAVPKTGSIANIRMLQKLKWEHATYGQVRDRLVKENLLLPGRGRGGSVRRLVEDSTVVAAESMTPAAVSVSEGELYEPILNIIRR